ncbi:MAG: DUF364 domain-containing protein [Gammaproteobacteria bacterium]|nr:DUF364 domain-containing protein [Gammaproteobacteria bacterium]
MSINADYLALSARLDAALPPAGVIGLHLPDPLPDETFRDEFGFVLLADGSVGPFYVSMGGLLEALWRRHPDPASVRMPRGALLEGFRSDDPAGRALAVGAFNALSQSLMRRAGYRPPGRGAGNEGAALAPGDTVGMVGYFCPVVDRLVAAGMEVLVLEHAPQRVPERAAVRVTTEPRDLAGCRQVVCTASVLINDTLDGLLAAAAGVAPFQLIGPTGSGLPDALFARGVAAVGGIDFGDAGELLARLARREPWGKAGRKYEITPDRYPGVEALLARLS